MIRTISLFITPLRIFALYQLILSVEYYLNTERLQEQGYEPGLGGLAHWVYGGIALISLLLDLILSLNLKPKKNWIIQSILIVVVILTSAIVLN